MSKKLERRHVEKLKEMIQEKKPDDPVEKILVKFCERHGVSMDTCRVYYKRLVREGKVRE